MKKFLAILICAVVMTGVTIALTGCGEPAPSVVTTRLFSATSMDKELSDFLTANPNRTSLTKAMTVLEKDGEELASEWLETRLTEILGESNVSRKSFSRTTAYNDAFDSFNVVGRVRANTERNPEEYRIVIGAHYDNTYSPVAMSNYSGSYYFAGSGAEGAMGSGTGVATVLQLARYFSTESVRNRLTVDIDFAFYGMGCIDLYGSVAYLSNLGETARSKLLLAVNIESLGGDELFAYFDETPTAHGEFILGAADDAGVGNAVGEQSAFTADYAVQVVPTLQYAPKPLISVASTFFGVYNICSFTSGSDNTFFVRYRESSNSDNIANTASDTLATLKRERPIYAAQMAVAAETIATAVLKDGFTDACLTSRSEINRYQWLGYPLVGYITVAVLSLAAVIIITVLVRRFEKKHHSDPEIKRNVKVAVFGMDYEQPKDNDVFIDIQNTDPFANAFDDQDQNPKEDKEDDKEEK